MPEEGVGAHARWMPVRISRPQTIQSCSRACKLPVFISFKSLTTMQAQQPRWRQQRKQKACLQTTETAQMQQRATDQPGSRPPQADKPLVKSLST